jgi:hypothetical protein
VVGDQMPWLQQVVPDDAVEALVSVAVNNSAFELDDLEMENN